jgi:methyl-accepting chemotaxis protein
MTSKKPEKFKRRQYLINRKFQLIFIMKFLLVLVVGGVLSVATTMLTTQASLTSSFEGSRLVIEKTSMAILPSVILTNIITTLVVGVFVIIGTLLLSHKIAGPMFRFEQALGEIAQGDLQQNIKIRSGDQFTGVADNLNGMVTHLNATMTEVQLELERISKAAAAQNLPQAFIDDLASCRDTLDSKFKL